MKYSYIKSLRERERIPRKNKKNILGRKLSNSELKLLLKEVVIHSNSKTMYEISNITPYIFCPFCGCVDYYGTGNLSCYPEHWEYFKCLRYHSNVGYIDNSPFIHALQCPDNNYDPVF